MANSDEEYLQMHGVDYGRIARRYRKTLEFVHIFVNVKGIAPSIIIDGKILKTTLYDYFVDIVRIKEFHELERVDVDKIYSHMAYWLLKRKPIQVIKPFPGSEFVNELFVASYLISNILVEKAIPRDRIIHNTRFNRFQ